ncbi:MAG: T9SS type A sorting domain-containing protein [Bacteroidetes bacterium]|nr:MAG: T9SS type A sorting domain-containing protein [Bacteroidota bacterium]
MKKFILSAILLFICFSAIKGSHILGGEITYKYLSQNKYWVTLTLYRDCGSSSQISGGVIVASCNTDSAAFTLTKTKVTDITQTNPACGGALGTCGIGTFPYGIEANVWEGEIDLSSFNCCEITLSRQECCGGGYSTISASSTVLYFEAKLNKCLQNSSPVFDKMPTFLLPVAKDAFISYHAVDSLSGDSISYELTSPRRDASTAITYSGSHSAAKPITFLGFPNAALNLPGGFSLDNSNGTGNLAFRPVKANEKTLLSLKVTEWRKVNGVMTIIGQINRVHSIEMYSPSGNEGPTFLKPAANVFNICDSIGTHCFEISIKDSDAGDSVILSWQHNLKNATFSRTGSANAPVLKVCFLVDSAEYFSGTQRYIMVTAEDNACPKAVSITKTFVIGMRSKNIPDLFTINKANNCTSITWSANSNNNYHVDYNWNVQAPDSTYNSTNRFVLTKHLNTPGISRAKLTVSSPDYCNSQTMYDSTIVPTSIKIKARLGADTVLCNDSIISIQPVVTDFIAPLNYIWGNDTVTGAYTIHVPKGINTYTVKVVDSAGCTSTDTIKISYAAPQVVASGAYVLCKGGSINLTAAMNDTVSPVYSWDGYSLQQQTINDFPASSRLYIFKLNDLGCETSDTVVVTVNNPKINITGNTEACLRDSVVLTANVSGTASPYNIVWKPSNTGNNSLIVYETQQFGPLQFLATVTDSVGCKDSATHTLLYKPLPALQGMFSPLVCITIDTIDLTTAIVPTGGVWSGTAVTGNYFMPPVAGRGLHYQKYQYTSPSSGCTNSLSTYFRVMATPAIDFTANNTTVAKNTEVSFTNLTTADTAFTSKWVFGLPETALNTKTDKDPKFTFADTGLYTVKLVINDGVCEPDTVIKTNYIRVSQPTNVNLIAGKPEALKIYPNPATNQVWLALPKGENIAVILLTDIMGREIKNIEVIGDKLLLTDLNTGVYMLRVFTDAKKAYSGSIIIE